MRANDHDRLPPALRALLAGTQELFESKTTYHPELPEEVHGVLEALTEAAKLEHGYAPPMVVTQSEELGRFLVDVHAVDKEALLPILLEAAQSLEGLALESAVELLVNGFEDALLHERFSNTVFHMDREPPFALREAAHELESHVQERFGEAVLAVYPSSTGYDVHVSLKDGEELQSDRLSWRLNSFGDVLRARHGEQLGELSLFVDGQSLETQQSLTQSTQFGLERRR